MLAIVMHIISFCGDDVRNQDQGINGAGDRDRTGDIQLGNLKTTYANKRLVSLFNNLVLVTFAESRRILASTIQIRCNFVGLLPAPRAVATPRVGGRHNF